MVHIISPMRLAVQFFLVSLQAPKVYPSCHVLRDKHVHERQVYQRCAAIPLYPPLLLPSQLTCARFVSAQTSPTTRGAALYQQARCRSVSQDRLPSPSPKPFHIPQFTSKQARIGHVGPIIPGRAGEAWWWQCFNARITA